MVQLYGRYCFLLCHHHSFHFLGWWFFGSSGVSPASSHLIGHWQLRGAAAGKLVTRGNCSERLLWANGTTTTTITTIVGRWIRTTTNGRSPVTIIGSLPGTRVTRQLWNVWGSEFGCSIVWWKESVVKNSKGTAENSVLWSFCIDFFSNMKRPRQYSSETSSK